MANKLFEAYKNRLAIAESVYKAAHSNQPMNEHKKLVVAKVLENQNKLLNESFEQSAGTNRSDLGMWKKFSMNLANVTLPNLIAHELVIVHPMSSMSGYISYVEYTAGTNKGATKRGDVFNSPFALGTFRDGAAAPLDANYTSSCVVTEGAVPSTAESAQTAFPLTWVDVVAGTAVLSTATTTYYDGGDGKVYTLAAGGTVSRIINGDGTVTVTFTGTATQAGTIVYTGASAGITLTTGLAAGTAYKVTYNYNNEVVPQNDLPILNAEIKAIPLIAKARRIAIYYSQIAAFQAKTDYGMDLGAQLSDQAVGRLSYEIDTEVCNLLIDNAAAESSLNFNKAIPIGISKAEHYEGFSETVSQATKLIYSRTQKFLPNYMLVAQDVINVLKFINGWTPAPASNINGPYFAGTLDHLKVFVTPNIADGTFVVGVNGDDFMSSAAVYAPYMAIVPTQLLGFSDGAMSQGWSTLYDLKMLNPLLLVKGSITNVPATANEQVIKTDAQ